MFTLSGLLPYLLAAVVGWVLRHLGYFAPTQKPASSGLQSSVPSGTIEEQPKPVAPLVSEADRIASEHKALSEQVKQAQEKLASVGK